MKYVVANWKMHMTGLESERFLADLVKEVTPGGIEVILAPSNFALYALSKVKQWQFKLCAQNFYHKDFGAYTGETAVKQLIGVADYALVGHSERRQYFGETNEATRQKMPAALSVRVKPILCIGETAQERAQGESADVVRDQLAAGLADVTASDLRNVLIAYEPVWSISTTANRIDCTPEDAAEMLDLIRSELAERYGENHTPILFGGSVKADNVVGYMTDGKADGVLVGGASLQVKGFSAIIEAVKAIR